MKPFVPKEINGGGKKLRIEDDHQKKEYIPTGEAGVKTMRSIFLWTALLYIAYCSMLYLLQRQMLFPVNLVEAPADMAVRTDEVEKIWLDTVDGKIETWYLPPQKDTDSPAPVVIFGHGNAELIDLWPAEFRRFSEMGIGLLLVEYPGYGRSAGSPSQASITRTFVAAYDRITARPDVDPERVVLFGRSVGGGAVCQLAARRPSAALILFSTFTSARSFARRYLVPGFLMRHPFDNLAVVRAYENPVLVLHGSRDGIIAYDHGRKLAEAAPDGRLVTYNCAHNDCPPSWKQFWQDVALFLREADISAPRETIPPFREDDLQPSGN